MHFRESSYFRRLEKEKAIERSEHKERRARVSSDVADYLASGGTITEIPSGDSGENLGIRRNALGRLNWADGKQREALRTRDTRDRRERQEAKKVQAV